MLDGTHCRRRELLVAGWERSASRITIYFDDTQALFAPHSRYIFFPHCDNPRICLFKILNIFCCKWTYFFHPRRILSMYSKVSIMPELPRHHQPQFQVLSLTPLPPGLNHCLNVFTITHLQKVSQWRSFPYSSSPFTHKNNMFCAHHLLYTSFTTFFYQHSPTQQTMFGR